jgi:hypothetical protein
LCKNNKSCSVLLVSGKLFDIDFYIDNDYLYFKLFLFVLFLYLNKMNIVRKRYEWDQRAYFKNLNQQYGKIPENHQQAIELRQDFFRKEVLDKVNSSNNLDSS